MTDTLSELEPADPATFDDPYALFALWFAEAEAQEVNDPQAMGLATVDEDGLPNLRMVLMRGVDARGFVFFTNFESAKGRELLAARRAAINFHWKSLRRQVRARGAIAVVTEAEADAYFAGRPRLSQIGAWASDQSRPIADRAALEAKVRAVEARYAGQDVPRPPHWSGFRLSPRAIEFWRDGAFRLHDRFEFIRDDATGAWSRRRLSP